MASIPCSIYLQIPFSSFSPSPSSSGLRSPFLALTRWLGWLRASRMRGKLGPGTAGWRAGCWFRFGIDGSQSRDDFDRDDVEQYFNYMGMLAIEGSYDKREALLNKNIHPVDILLTLAEPQKVTNQKSRNY